MVIQPEHGLTESARPAEMEPRAEPTQADDIKNKPSFVATSGININGKEGKRLMVVYRTVGCAYDVGGKGCTMCDFRFHADPSITSDNLRAQHEKVMEKLRAQQEDPKEDPITQFDVLTLGSFYNNRETTPEMRKYFLETLATVPSIERVLTEGRRTYTTVERLKEAKACLREDQTLEYALGYESVTEEIRNGVLNKGVPERHLDQALDMCKEAGVDFVSYVLIKPHTLTEIEGIEEATATALHVLAKAKAKGVNARIAFEPVFVTKGKILEELFEKGEYTPPKLWSVVEVMKRTAAGLGTQHTEGKLFVGLSDENLSNNRMPANCGECDARVAAAIQKFNRTQDVASLEGLDCACKHEWEAEIRTALQTESETGA